jgi:hypothetical protein
MYVGHAFYGLTGFVVGVASVELVLLPVQAVLLARRKLWQPSLDVCVLSASAAIILMSLTASKP